MKKKILTFVAICAAMTANAAILRVSNVNGSTAPYQTIQAAHDAADAGDTIMVDGSMTKYDKTIITKQLVIIGPGYWITENGLVQEGAPSATAEFEIRRGAPGTVIEGFWFRNVNGPVVIMADNCVVRRCYFYDHGGYKAIIFSRDQNKDDPDPTGGVIHQNFFADCAITTRYLQGLMTHVQITNNIFVNNGASESDIQNINSSYIGYNTMIGSNNRVGLATVYGSTIEHNFIRIAEVDKRLETHPNWKLWLSNANYLDTNEWNDNIELPHSKKDVDYKTDKDIYTLEQTLNEGNDCGAFAEVYSDDPILSPYVISGVPSAPVIQDLVVPTTVEAGSKMQVTIKLGIQK